MFSKLAAEFLGRFIIDSKTITSRKKVIDDAGYDSKNNF
jgi:hypothetical protein